MKINKIANFFYREETLNKLRKKIKLLGINKKYDAIDFMNLRVFTSFIIFIVVIFTFKTGYILAPILTYLYYITLPSLYFDHLIKKREKVIEHDALYFFRVLALSLESGNNLINAIDVTSKSINSDLSLEFREVIKEVNLGKSLDDALISLKDRIPGDTINNIILNIRESNLFGNNIIDTLYNQIDYISEKIILNTKAYISKLPLKISVISVIFFLPLLLLIILGPVILNYLS